MLRCASLPNAYKGYDAYFKNSEIVAFIVTFIWLLNNSVRVHERVFEYFGYWLFTRIQSTVHFSLKLAH